MIYYFPQQGILHLHSCAVVWFGSRITTDPHDYITVQLRNRIVAKQQKHKPLGRTIAKPQNRTSMYFRN